MNKFYSQIHLGIPTVQIFWEGHKNFFNKARYIKFVIYSEKATKFWEISTLLLSYVLLVKSKVEISQNFVTFSEYMNFNNCVQPKKIESLFSLLHWKNNYNNLFSEKCDYETQDYKILVALVYVRNYAS